MQNHKSVLRKRNMAVIENKILWALLLYATVTVVLSASPSADSINVGSPASPQVPLEKQSETHLTSTTIEKRPRQADDDDDDSVLERITKGFNRVISNAFKGTVSVVFGTQNEEGEREDGIITNFVKSPLAKPLNALFQSGVGSLTGANKPAKGNVTKKASATQSVRLSKTTTKRSTNEEVENEEDDSEEEDN